jgi:endonuclease YncB( thermonuclease family)
LFKISDGDTPQILQPVRMVSTDTPEKAGYAGRPELAQAKLDECRSRLAAGFFPAIPASMVEYLVDKLTPDAAERHIAAGEAASAAFDQLLEDRLTRPTGTQRPVATIPSGEVVDRYGRLLAYLAPWFAGGGDPLPPKGDPRRRTFNLDMVAVGWAAPFLIYPSLPHQDDLDLFLTEATAAWDQKLGAWQAFGDDLLLGYEYRLCIKLGTAKTATAGVKDAFQRVCIDVSGARPRSVGRFGWADVAPPDRLWVWTKDVARASIDLGIAVAA